MRLIERHADAWLGDPLYRRACFLAPFAIVVGVGVFALGRPARLSIPAAPSRWVHPTNESGAAKALVSLRDQAKTNAEALVLLRRQADGGNRFAQFFMGTLNDPLIDRARASPDRTKEAVAWYRKAADQHVEVAASNLGLLLAYDRPGLPADYAEAFRLLDMAAPAVPQAQRELGQLYRLGHGVPIDDAKGIGLIRAAADRNDAAAQAILAQTYDRGTDGLTQDPHEAAMLFQRAALAGNVFAEREIGVHLARGLGVPADKEKAMTWFKQAADRGDVYSKAQLSGANAPGTPLPGPTVPSPAPSFPPIKP